VGEVVKAVRLLHGGELWGGPARTMAGLSNLRSGLRHTYPLRVEEAALALLAGAGLGLAPVDVLQPGPHGDSQGHQPGGVISPLFLPENLVQLN